jgi:hypothetical protein
MQAHCDYIALSKKLAQRLIWVKIATFWLMHLGASAAGTCLHAGVQVSMDVRTKHKERSAQNQVALTRTAHLGCGMHVSVTYLVAEEGVRAQIVDVVGLVRERG